MTFETPQIAVHPGASVRDRVYHTRDCRAYRNTDDDRLRDVRPGETDRYRECDFCQGAGGSWDGLDGSDSLEKRLRDADAAEVFGE